MRFSKKVMFGEPFPLQGQDGQTPLPKELQRGLKPRHIQAMGELDEYEEQNIAEGLIWLEKQSEDGTAYKSWLKLHKKLFCDVWTWAGKIREHELNNPDFHQPHQIRPALWQLEKDLASWIKEKTYPEEEIAARFHQRIETIHPFANGNGRFGRILVEHFCSRNGLKSPTWGGILRDDPKERRKSYIAALETARRTRNHDQLTNFMYS